MITLDNTNETLEIKLAGAVSANQAHVSVTYNDYLNTGSTRTYGPSKMQHSTSNSTTAATICDAPAAATTAREINHVAVFNNDTASITATLQVNENGTARIQAIMTLLTKEQLYYVHGRGWYGVDANGYEK